MEFVSEITDVETIASGTGARDRKRLQKQYGRGRWHKLKGIALIRLHTGRVRLTEVHWYEAHSIGRKEFKRKRYLD